MTTLTWTTIVVETLSFLMVALTIYTCILLYPLGVPWKSSFNFWTSLVSNSAIIFYNLCSLICSYLLVSFNHLIIVNVPAEDLGISFNRKIGEGTVITKVNTKSPLAGKVAVGYEILSINNTRISSLSMEQFEILTKDLHLQPCTLIMIPTGKKKTVQAPPNSLVLSYYAQAEDLPCLYVESITNDSPLFGEIVVGDKISSINGLNTYGIGHEKAQLLMDTVANNQCELIVSSEGQSLKWHRIEIPFRVFSVCVIFWCNTILSVELKSIFFFILNIAIYIIALSILCYRYLLWIR